MNPRLHRLRPEAPARFSAGPHTTRFLSLVLLPLVLALGLALSTALAETSSPPPFGQDERCGPESPPPQSPFMPNTPGKHVPRCGEMPKQDDSSDKTLAPYFFLNGENAALDALPLKSSRAEVNISGVIAEVRISQVYRNDGQKVLEAIYVFPASSRAAVHAARMTIGQRRIDAQIRERQKAREEYEQARREGKTASLLEQERPNVFQMNVVNILPKDEVQVELEYTELLVPEEGVYEFVYPTVVGPRYSNQPEATAPAGERFVQNPYLHQGQPATSTFGIHVTLSQPLPIDSIFSPSHDLLIEFTGKNEAHIGLADEAAHGNRDLVLRYSLAQDRIQSGLITYQGEKENYFLLLMEPPKRPAESAVVARELLFIVDVSGSMHGFPLDTAKTLLRDLLAHLRPQDAFNLMTFSGGNEVLSPTPLVATPQNIQSGLDMIERQSGGGGTELLPALERALALPRAAGKSRLVVIVSDGYVHVERQAFELIEKKLGQANFFPFGIGSSVNRHLIEGLARVGRGEPFIILKPQEAAEKARHFRAYIERPLLSDIQLRFEGFAVSAIEPPTLPDLFAGRPLVVFGKYTGPATGTIRLSAKTSTGDFTQVLSVAATPPEPAHAALRLLWARQRLLHLSDFNTLFPSESEKAEITRLGLDYHLLTAFTSFIAVDTLSRTKEGATTVKQPLPLPQGVEDSAVGGGLLQKSAAMGLGAQGYGLGGAALGLGQLSTKTTPGASNPVAPPPASSNHTGRGQGTRADKNDRRTLRQPSLRITILAAGDARQEAALETALRQQQGALLAGYQKYQQQNPALKGLLRVALKIGPNGQVQAVTLKHSTLKQVELEKELLHLLARLLLAVSAQQPGQEALIELSFTPN